MEEKKKDHTLAVEIIKKCIFPVISGVILAIVYGTYLNQVKDKFKISWFNLTDKIFFVLMILVIAYWIRAIIMAIFNWYISRISDKTDTAIDNQFLPLFKRLASLIVWIVALIIILSFLGVNISALIATLGVGSLAIALAAQDTISNIIAGFLIMVDRPFRIGDEIKLPTGEKVEVLSIGIRRSRFRAEDGAIVIVPNLDLSKSKIINYSYSEND